jgi:drug/metabolite transporter (DMT)-like permease
MQGTVQDFLVLTGRPGSGAHLSGTFLFSRLSAVRGQLLVMAGSFCISFAALFVKGASMDPSVVVFYRLLFGGIALVAVALWRRERLMPPRSLLGVMAAAAAFFFADLTTWHACIVRLGPGLATILANFQVFFLALFGAFFLRESLSRQHKAAIPLALIGLAMLLEVDPRTLPRAIVSGVLFGLAASLFYTGYILTLRYSQTVTEHMPPIANMALVSLFTAVFSGLFCAGFSLSFKIPDAETALILAALGIFCQAFGWVLLSQGLPLLPASRAGLIMLTQPAFSFFWDILFYNRPTGAVGFAGAVLAIGAIGLGVGKTGKGKIGR